MKIGIRLFISSTIFGAAISIIYWFSSHDPTGTILLGIMCGALLFAAGYSFFAERDAALSGDRAGAMPGDERGVKLGVFTLRSPWPIVVAAGAFLLLTGLAISSTAAVSGFLIISYGIYRLIAESR